MSCTSWFGIHSSHDNAYYFLRCFMSAGHRVLMEAGAADAAVRAAAIYMGGVASHMLGTDMLERHGPAMQRQAQHLMGAGRSKIGISRATSNM